LSASRRRYEQAGGDIASFAHQQVVAAACGPGIHGFKTDAMPVDEHRQLRRQKMQLLTGAENNDLGM